MYNPYDQAIIEVKSAIDQARQWPGFKNVEPEICKIIKSNNYPFLSPLELLRTCYNDILEDNLPDCYED